MKRFASESQVDGGYYLNTTSWELHAVDGNRGVLPGAPGTRWLRLPGPVMLFTALAISLAFVIFVPFIGIALFAAAVAVAAARGLKGLFGRLAHTLAPQWQPGEAWLARREPTDETKDSTAVEALRTEIDQRRASESEATHNNK